MRRYMQLSGKLLGPPTVVTVRSESRTGVSARMGTAPAFKHRQANTA